jgi:hypothetical protein
VCLSCKKGNIKFSAVNEMIPLTLSAGAVAELSDIEDGSPLECMLVELA